MTLPSQMRYIAHAPGGPEVLHVATGPVPQPREGEVLIRVEAAGVNRPDVQQRLGEYPPPPGASPMLGLEVAGEVVAVGGDGRLRQSATRSARSTNGGGYAEYCTAPAAQCLPWPQGYDAVRAGGPAGDLLHRLGQPLPARAGCSPARRALIHGGTGGIGVTAIQLAHEFGSTRLSPPPAAPEKCEACVPARRRCGDQLQGPRTSLEASRRSPAASGRERGARHGRRPVFRRATCAASAWTGGW